MDLAGRRDQAEGPPHPAGEGQGAGLGSGVDPGRRQPGGQRLLVRLRAAGAAEGDRRRRGRRGGPAAPAGRRRSRPTRPSRAPPRCSRRTSSPASTGTRSPWSCGRPRCRTRTRASRSRRSSSAAARRSSSRPEHRATATLRRPLDGLAGTEGARRPVEGWRGDEDLLAHTQSGAPLPVGQLQVRRSCGLSGGELTPWRRSRAAPRCWPAPTTDGGGVVLLRHHAGAAATPRWRPAASSCTSWCSGRWPAGPASLGTTRQLTAGEPTRDDPAALGAHRRRRGGDLDRIRRASGRLCLRATGCWPSTARPPRNRRRPAGRPPR